MRKDVVGSKIKLGIFFLLAFALLTALIFYIGSRQHIFGSKVKIYALFEDVSGLNQGNSVRFQGVTIGVVEKIQIVSDSVVKVVMVIDDDVAKFIKEDSEASILSEGVLGSKFVSISAGSSLSVGIKNEGQIQSNNPRKIEDMLVTLAETSNSAKNLTENLESITRKINNGEGSLGALVTDKSLMNKVEYMVDEFAETGRQANKLTGNLSLFVDTIGVAGRNMVEVTENVVNFTNQLNNSDGPIQKLIGDTVLAFKMEKSLDNVNQAAKDIGQTSCRVRNHWFMRMFAKSEKKSSQ